MSDAPFDVALHGRLKHGALYAAMRARGWNQSELGRHLGVEVGKICQVMNLSVVPKLTEADVKKLLELTGKLPDELWPEWTRSKDFLDADKRVAVTKTVTRALLQARGVLQLPPAPDEVFVETELRERLSEQIATLTPREAEVIRMRYGLDGEREHTAREAAERRGVSPGRIHQIEARALRKLRHPGRSRGLRSYLY